MNLDQLTQSVSMISQELSVPQGSVNAVLQLLEEGNTVPFIARYRKEATGNLDEVQIRSTQERYQYLTELEERKKAILASIEEQGKLTDDLTQKIEGCFVKATLEDLYLPFKQKRRTRATKAKEKGLEPLAEWILKQGNENVESIVQTFINPELEVTNEKEAWAGARDIVAEIFSENAEIRAMLRSSFLEEGLLVTESVPEKANEPTKFEQYYEFSEAVKTIPSHRFLAIQRGEREGVLRVRIQVDEEQLQAKMLAMLGWDKKSSFSEMFQLAVKESYKRLLSTAVETDVRVELKMRSDRSAVDVFADNLKNLLLEAPFGQKNVIGIDPGIRTGCKMVAISDTGKFLDTTTLYIHRDVEMVRAKSELLQFIDKYRPSAIAVGNGTYGRETETFVRQTLKDIGLQAETVVVLVNESGASIYSASDVAREEFPDLDLTIRGSISIARRLQDPLSELVKIDPKSIGVGQYQHDVFQSLLQKKLDEVVESCVNNVGVELNLASAPLLSYVAGIGKSLAKKIVQYRDKKGSFLSREQLKEVPGMGQKTFEQAAGFLRIRGAENPLDFSSVHPERYDLVQNFAKDLGIQINELIGNKKYIDQIEVSKYINENVGKETLKDILSELNKPGRDPRATFAPPQFREDVTSIQDLRIGMTLEGIVTNVTAFGAFVDVGVKQDGLVHISRLSDRYVSDPSEVAKVGQKMKVVVLEVDAIRNRISLSANSNIEPDSQSNSSTGRPQNKTQTKSYSSSSNNKNESSGYRPFEALLKKK